VTPCCPVSPTATERSAIATLAWLRRGGRAADDSGFLHSELHSGGASYFPRFCRALCLSDCRNDVQDVQELLGELQHVLRVLLGDGVTPVVCPVSMAAVWKGSASVDDW
jgi:hypothetical protein